MPRPDAETPTLSGGAETLRASIAALIGEAAAASERFGIAVSGGPDSLALLLLAHTAFPGRVAAASVDHRLRAEAAQECAHVAAICATLGVPHHILTPDTPPQPNQAGARVLRYDLLETWRVASGIDWLMTGHHADDQLETMVMRLNRSSGVGGLAGVRARNGRVLRPLLSWRRDDLAAIVAGASVMPIDDPSNRDPKHDRARLRLAMAEQDWLDPVAVSASAGHLAQAEEALVWAAAQLFDERVERVGDDLSLDPTGLPDELRFRLVVAVLAEMGATSVRHGDVATLIARVMTGDAATLAGIAVRVAKTTGATTGGRWLFRPAPPHRETVL